MSTQTGGTGATDALRNLSLAEAKPQEQKAAPAPTPELSEDEIDDLLYFARAGELVDLKEILEGLAKGNEIEVLERAVEVESGNSVVHMAAANGHVGEILSFPLNFGDAFGVLMVGPSYPNLHHDTPTARSDLDLFDTEYRLCVYAVDTSAFETEECGG
jgi:hypothetical protein